MRTRHTLLSTLAAAVLALAASSHALRAADVAPRSAESAAQEEALIKLLASDAPDADKALACKKLAIYGSGKSVPSVAPMLADARFSSWARTALEAIPGEEADAALREAETKLSGRLLIGVINSIGFRRDGKAADQLAARLGDKDAAVASSAAVALGKIGNPVAAKALRAALADAPDAVRSAVAEGCILCAERRTSEGSPADAVAIYDEVRKADVPKQRKLEATRGAILARGGGGVDLLLEQLRSDDKGYFQIGLSAARELPGRQATEAVAAEVSRATSQRGALLLFVLADRRDPAATPAVLEAVKSGDKPLRIAAIGVLENFADESSVPTLLEIAADEDADLAEAAQGTLVRLKGEKVNAQIASRLAKAEGRALGVLIALAGQRRIEATADLARALKNDDAEIRKAALAALGQSIGQKDLPLLVEYAVKPANPEDAEAASGALKTACVRMPDREACAATLSAAMQKASVETQCMLLDVLGAMGGAKALATIGGAARSSEAKLQDASTRVLGQWMSADAAPVLLDLVKEIKDDRYQGRAFRAYLRLARQFAKNPAHRAEMCERAWAAAPGTAERKLVLAVVERYPSPETLRVAIAATNSPDLKEEAKRVALAVGQKVAGNSPEARAMLAKIGFEPVKLEIVKAQYGAGAAQKDVTDVVRKLAKDLPIVSIPSDYNSTFGGDPAPGVRKQLKIEYKMNGKGGEATFAENDQIVLPTPK